jgi:hypothetical protein
MFTSTKQLIAKKRNFDRWYRKAWLVRGITQTLVGIAILPFIVHGWAELFGFEGQEAVERIADTAQYLQGDSIKAKIIGSIGAIVLFLILAKIQQGYNNRFDSTPDEVFWDAAAGRFYEIDDQGRIRTADSFYLKGEKLRFRHQGRISMSYVGNFSSLELGQLQNKHR